MSSLVQISELPPSFFVNKELSLFEADWLDVLTNTYGYTFQVLYNTEEYIVFTEVRNSSGRKIVSIPFADYTRLNPHKPAAQALIAELVQLYPHHQIKVNGILPEANAPKTALGIPISYSYLHRINLQEDVQQSVSFSRNVRKAQKNHLKFHTSSSYHSLWRFYELHAKLRQQKLKLLTQPASFISALYYTLITTGNAFIAEVYHQEELICSAICIAHRKELYYKFGASSQKHLHLRPNNFLFANLIEYSRNCNFDILDLGLSATDKAPGLPKFKNSMGATQSYIAHYQYTPPDWNPKNERNRKLVQAQVKQVIEANLPIDIRNSYSALLYPQLV